jgi:hypothetical protein
MVRDSVKEILGADHRNAVRMAIRDPLLDCLNVVPVRDENGSDGLATESLANIPR